MKVAVCNVNSPYLLLLHLILYTETTFETYGLLADTGGKNSCIALRKQLLTGDLKFRCANHHNT